ncbi:MAG: pentapeptide repeat-containing protein [Aphanocapsa sp. GSE-SYN-MK-11-07L]|nr:pentapeptide repeat-containing protein [Aphanocapsa sp. GSE-SYN-MK-11-07L]
MILDQPWLIVAGMTINLLIAFRVLWPSLLQTLTFIASQELSLGLAAILGLFLVVLGYLHLTGVLQFFLDIYQEPNWDAIGAIGEGVVGAFGQILIAMIALWVAWRQYTIEKVLTTQQNRITQQQTIDTYFQGISDLVIDQDGLLEDWPQERAIAEGRTAALLGSVDNHGKAKILRFLSHSNLLTPLQRDRHLGRAMLDGSGGYAEDREQGIRVINLKMMLAGTDLSDTDLRGSDLSDASFFEANLGSTDLTRTNLSRAILGQANLRQAKLDGARLFYGTPETASPRSRTTRPNFQTGAHTGAVIEDVDLTEVRGLSTEQHYYCCAWGGASTRATIPGGCENIPNQLAL